MVENKEYLYALNVSLPDYFEKVQHYLDCAAYENEYEFPPLFKKESDFKPVAKKCLDDFDEEATSLTPECNQMCQKLGVANFSPQFESNHTYVVKAVNTFETLSLHAIEIYETRRKNEFNEVAKITKENEQEVKNVGATETAKLTEKDRIAQEKLDARLLKEKLEREERERLKRLREEEERKRREAAKPKKKKKPWWKFWKVLKRDLKSSKNNRKLRKLIKGKSTKTSMKIAKNFMKKIKTERKSSKKKKSHWKKLSKKLIQKHLKNHRRKRYRILEAAKPQAPPPPGPPKDPIHEALLKKQKEIYDQIEFMFDKTAPGVVKTADLPLDVDSFVKEFLYGQGIDINLYAANININISRAVILAILNGEKLGDAMENRLRQILDIFDEEFKAALAMALDTSFIFNLGGPDTTAAEGEFASVPEHYLPVECFTADCADAPPEVPAEGAEAEGDKPVSDGDKPAEKKPEEKKPAENPSDSKQSRILQMDKGFDELEGLFDLRQGSKKKEILF